MRKPNPVSSKKRKEFAHLDTGKRIAAVAVSRVAPNLLI